MILATDALGTAHLAQESSEQDVVTLCGRTARRDDGAPFTRYVKCSGCLAAAGSPIAGTARGGEVSCRAAAAYRMVVEGAFLDASPRVLARCGRWLSVEPDESPVDCLACLAAGEDR